jgi:hypothetical protein
MITITIGAGASSDRSARCIKMLSIAPRKYAVNAPMIVPTSIVESAATIAVTNEGVVAASNMLNTSRPKASVPNRWLAEGDEGCGKISISYPTNGSYTDFFHTVDIII